MPSLQQISSILLSNAQAEEVFNSSHYCLVPLNVKDFKEEHPLKILSPARLMVAGTTTCDSLVQSLNTSLKIESSSPKVTDLRSSQFAKAFAEIVALTGKTILVR